VRGNDAGNIRLGDITAMVKAAHADGSLTRNIAQEAMARTEALYRLLRELVGGEHAVDLQPLLARLRPLAEYIKNVVPQITTDAMPSAALTTTPPSNRAEPPALPAEIRSRQDVARMLDQICAYFEKNEPSNPAPLLLRRAQRLSTMNFFDIVRDIAPDALGAVETVAGSRPDQHGTNHE
jgi:type VI secretion system protein ImpA